MLDEMEFLMLQHLKISDILSKNMGQGRKYFRHSLLFFLKNDSSFKKEPVLMQPSSQHQALQRMRRNKEILK
jgi:hypothetical protein